MELRHGASRPAPGGMTAHSRAHFHHVLGTRHPVPLPQHDPAPSATSRLVPGHRTHPQKSLLMERRCSPPAPTLRVVEGEQQHTDAQEQPCRWAREDRGAQRCGEEMPSQLQQHSPCSRHRWPRSQCQKGAGELLQSLSWKFPTVVFTTG